MVRCQRCGTSMRATRRFVAQSARAPTGGEAWTLLKLASPQR
jgi:hypothetical protein